MTVSDAKLARKRYNEQAKSLSSTFSNLGVAIGAAAFIEPAVSLKVDDVNYLWLGFAALFFVASFSVLGFMRSED